jgi:hypothetical protein
VDPCPLVEDRENLQGSHTGTRLNTRRQTFYTRTFHYNSDITCNHKQYNEWKRAVLPAILVCFSCQLHVLRPANCVQLRPPRAIRPRVLGQVTQLHRHTLWLTSISEFDFRVLGDGRSASARYANNSNYRNDSLIRKESMSSENTWII